LAAETPSSFAVVFLKSISVWPEITATLPEARQAIEDVIELGERGDPDFPILEGGLDCILSDKFVEHHTALMDITPSGVEKRKAAKLASPPSNQHLFLEPRSCHLVARMGA
jgi:hypothetical protein